MSVIVNKLDTNMRTQCYYRMFGYTVTIATHMMNIVAMLSRFDADVLEDPKLYQFWLLMCRFITCWTFVFQSIHAGLGLSCDLLTLQSEGKETIYLKQMKRCRDLLFASIVAPYSLAVPMIFWPLFLYNRELVLPTYTSKIVDTLSNHTMHTFILPLALWEMAFQRARPENHKLNLFVMTAYTAVYVSTLPYTYYELGVYPYPILTILHGTINFYFFVGFASLFVPFGYYLQWPLSKLLLGRKIKSE